MKQFGLIGYPLGHSFSKTYFTKKFQNLGLSDHFYDLFEIENIDLFPTLWDQYPDLIGINVTVPYKKEVMQYLNGLDESASKVGAVNVIKKEDGGLRGYNSDYYGFRKSLEEFISGNKVDRGLILGTGGASQAVKAVLDDLGIKSQFVSRSEKASNISYLKLNESGIRDYQLIINTTPLGMYPKVDGFPDILYEQITTNHLLYDLVYNPDVTEFMKKGMAHGAKVMNGLKMLHLQADRAWEIWNK